MIPYGTVVRHRKSGMLRLAVPSPDFMAAAFKEGDFLAAPLRPYGPDVWNEEDVEAIGHINEPSTIRIIKEQGFTVK